MFAADITTLRRQGKLADALALGQEYLTQLPDDVWIRRALAWVYYDLMKQAVESCDTGKMMESVGAAIDLRVVESKDDELLQKNFFRPIKTLIRNFVANAPAEGDVADVCSRLWECLRTVPLETHTEAYSNLLEAFLPAAEQWPEFIAFCEWWDFWSFRPEDFQKRTLSDGKSLMPLAEQVYIAYSKVLIQAGNAERIKTFLPFLEAQVDNRAMTYIGYYYAKLLLSLDADREDALRHVKPFARRKSGEFWIWQFLSEFFANDPDRQLACLLRATRCRAKEEFLVRVRQQLADAYRVRGDWPRARHHLDLCVKTRQKNGWKIDHQMLALVNSEVYRSVVANASPPFDFMPMTDAILGIGHKQRPDTKSVEKTLDGTVTANRAKTALFLHGKLDGQRVFALIPPKLARAVSEGDRATATIGQKRNEKRNEMGWVCVKINKMTT